MATSVIRSPRYWGHFFWPPGKTTIHFLWKKKKTLVNTVTSLIRPNVFGPLVTVLTGFRTKIFAIASCYQTSKVPSRNFGGRQFFVRQENPLFIDICPSSGHPPKKTSFNWPFWSYEKFRVSYVNKVAKTKNWWLFFVLMRTRPRWDLKGYLNQLITY